MTAKTDFSDELGEGQIRELKEILDSHLPRSEMTEKLVAKLSSFYKVEVPRIERDLNMISTGSLRGWKLDNPRLVFNSEYSDTTIFHEFKHWLQYILWKITGELPFKEFYLPHDRRPHEIEAIAFSREIMKRIQSLRLQGRVYLKRWSTIEKIERICKRCRHTWTGKVKLKYPRCPKCLKYF